MTDNAQVSDEVEKLRIAQDFQTVFGSQAGSRVLNYLLNVILLQDKQLLRMPPGAELSGNDALYLMGRKDAAVAINKILTYDPSLEKKPVVRKTAPRAYSDHQPPITN